MGRHCNGHFVITTTTTGRKKKETKKNDSHCSSFGMRVELGALFFQWLA
jgi:hypothetical protein